jgi:hypothetical protein
MDEWFNKRFCDRCNGSLKNGFSMSAFNTDALCHQCKIVEQNHPDYNLAKEIERQEVLSGNRNFPGVGWPGVNGRIKKK